MAGKGKTGSLKINMILNTIKGIIGVLMPLITFPYVSRILGVENVGKVSFVNSVISYFSLFAALGLKMYTVSIGPRYRDDAEKMKKFADSVFTINMSFTCIAYIIMFFLVAIVPKFRGYTILFVILSMQIVLTTIGIDWLNSIYEDYLYITVRTIIFNLLQVTLLFAFVRTENDLINYAVVSVISSNGANVLNYFYTRKYCKVGLTKDVGWDVHMKPILVLFATQAMITIYVSLDVTILGFLCDDRAVGIYHVSVKIYTIIKSVVASMIAVSIPRLSNLYGQEKKQEFSMVAEYTYGTMLTVCAPAILGLVILKDEIISLISGAEYKDAVYSLAILSVAMFFCIGAYFWGQAILVPIGHEKILFKITVLSAAINIILNFMLIPFWQEKAAAFTTLIAEAVTFLICRYYGKKSIQIKSQAKISIKIFFGCVGIILVKYFLKFIGFSGNLYIVLMILFSLIVYFIIENIIKNEAISGISKILGKRTKGE